MPVAFPWHSTLIIPLDKASALSDNHKSKRLFAAHPNQFFFSFHSCFIFLIFLIDKENALI